MYMYIHEYYINTACAVFAVYPICAAWMVCTPCSLFTVCTVCNVCVRFVLNVLHVLYVLYMRCLLYALPVGNAYKPN